MTSKKVDSFIVNNIYHFQNESKVRIDFIDLVKGITILWIIWIHTDHPDFGNYRNPVFFLISGIFFKITDTKTFFTKRIWTIVIPFLFFYLLSIPFRFIVDLWDTRSVGSFDWYRVADIFKIEERHDYLSLNVPLWFLLTLLIIQSYSFLVFRLKRSIILIFCILSLIFFDYLNTIPTPLMINNALAWFGYFGIGYLIGKPLISFLNTLKRKVFIFGITLFVLLGCIWMEHLEVYDWNNLIGKTKVIIFIICFMSFFSFFNGWNKLEILRFYGKNSLIVLGAHLWILLPIERIMFRLLRYHSPWVGLGMAVLTAIILIPIINWMNNKVPFLIGKNKINNTY